MSFDEDLTACAGLVQRGDADRFMAVMAAPVAARRVLFPLYALNLEVARAPWVTQESMIAEMRLQWWRDVLGEIVRGGTVRRHEVATPLSQVLTPGLAEQLDGMIEARRWDIYRDSFEDQAALERHIDRTAGTLMWVSARALGEADEEVVRDFAYASGVAGWLRAIPTLEAQGRVPLVDGTPDGVRALAQGALARLNRSRKARGSVSRAASPALLAGWQAGAVLKQALADPGQVAAGGLGPSEAAKRLSLMARAATGRW